MFGRLFCHYEPVGNAGRELCINYTLWDTGTKEACEKTKVGIPLPL